MGFPEFYDAPECIPTMAEYMEKHSLANATQIERIRRYKEMAHQLFDKYVRTGAAYEINIAYDLRMQFMSMMSDKAVWMNATTQIGVTQLFHLFDECNDAMVYLMAQSFSRFKRTDKWSCVVDILAGDGAKL